MPTLEKGPNTEALYAQLMAQLRTRILDGTLPTGTRLPTELELARSYQISRGTVRQAMTALVNEGLLERTQGRGTFVRERPAAQANEGLSADRRIGVILADPDGEMDLEVLIGVENAARPRGYQINFAFTEENMEQQMQDIARLQADRVAGMVIFPLRDTEYDASIWKLSSDGVPFVLVDRYFPTLDCDCVTSDNVGGGYRATEHLIILGHKRISYVYSCVGNLTTTSVRDRWEGYRRALREYGVPYDESLVYEAPRSDSRDHFDDLLTRADRPEAIFASNDTMALRIMQTAQRLGLRVPEDLAIVGIDNRRFAAHLHPQLTTIAQPFIDLGLRAGNMLINRIEGQGGPFRRVELPTSLIVRESCGARLHARNSSNPT
jgi:GntR family transcriptional regulator, arabinose operon transcriptional repressor